MTLAEWFDAVSGTAVDVDGSYGAQCMDLANDYINRVRGGSRMSGNAIDVPRQSVKGAVWQPNGRVNHPSPGDIAAWNWPPYGHVAVVLYATPMHLISLDQNWNGVMRAMPVFHTYAGCAGWHHFA